VKGHFKKHIGGGKVLLVFLLTNVVYLIMIGYTIPGVRQYANGNNLFDMMPGGYSADYALHLLTLLGEEGRSAYLHNQLPVDMIYPFLFGLCYSLLLAYFLNKLNRLETRLFYVTWLPILAGLFDYLENISIIFMLLRYPSFSPHLASLASVFTVIKSVLSTLSFLMLVVLLITIVIRFVKLRKT
jgi:hypothetical protein